MNEGVRQNEGVYKNDCQSVTPSANNSADGQNILFERWGGRGSCWSMTTKATFCAKGDKVFDICLISHAYNILLSEL